MSLKRLQVGNNGRASLQASISSVALSLSLYENSGATLEDYLAGIPSGTGIAFTITVEDELILCAARTGAAVTVYEEDTHLLGFLSAGENGRGYGSTSAASHDADKQAEVRSTKQLFDSLASGIEDAETELALRYTKDEIDAILRAKNWKDSVVCATDSAKTLASDFENGDVIDGVTLATGDRVLVKDQATKKDNGIYTVNASGAPTRATDFDATAEITGAAVVVEEGTANADALFICTSDDPVVGTDDIEFAQIVSLTKASQAEAEAGTDDVKYMTPLKTKQSLEANQNISDANATTLTGGAASDADALHTHDGLVNVVKSGVTTRDLSTASGNQTIAHGLGVTPKFIDIVGIGIGGSATVSKSHGGSNGTTNNCVGEYVNSGSHLIASSSTYCIVVTANNSSGNQQTGTITVNASNIIIAWTKTGTPTGTGHIWWKASA